MVPIWTEPPIFSAKVTHLYVASNVEKQIVGFKAENLVTSGSVG